MIETNRRFTQDITQVQAVFGLEGTLNDPSDQDQSWSVELRLPLDRIPGLQDKKPAIGDEWALNFYRFDRPKDGTTWAYAWSTAPRGDFHQVDKFGVGKIAAAAAAAPELKRPVVTPEMLKQMRRNIDLKVRPDIKKMQPSQPSVPPAVKPRTRHEPPAKTE